MPDVHAQLLGLKTYKDDAGLIHVAFVMNTWKHQWTTACDGGYQIHDGDVYYVKRRAITCIVCASLHGA